MLALSPVLFNACDKNDDEPIVKQDVRIGWNMTPLGGRPEDISFIQVLNTKKIQELQNKPTTGNIIAYPADDFVPGQDMGADAVIVNDAVTYLTERVKPMGVKFEPGTIHVRAFEKADSIKAQNELNLTIQLVSRYK